MKRIFVLLALVIIILVPIAYGQEGITAYPSLQTGFLMQKDQPSAFAWGGSALFPVITIDAAKRQLVGLEPEILTSDFQNGDKLYGKGYIVYERPFFSLFKIPFQLGIGTGSWIDLKAPGEDDLTFAAKGFVSAKLPYVEIQIGAESVMLNGDDLYLFSGTLKFIK
jgi:energy-converting hydrogenase Eha subunit A